jgi:predicted transposase YbfD/YdcC
LDQVFPKKTGQGFFEIFAQMEDPRRTSRGNFRHALTDIFLLTITAVLCGVSDWEQIQEFGKLQWGWFKKWGSFKHGIPSHDTMSRVFSALDPVEFSKCFSQWAQRMRLPIPGEVIGIDGKCARGSYDTVSGKEAIHIVSAYATQQNLCLGQRATDVKSNEITAIPELLDLLDLRGCMVSIDAMGCQKKIAEHIRGKEADYLLAVKENQKELCHQVAQSETLAADKRSHTEHDLGHGRVEKRTCTVWNDLRFVFDAHLWKDLSTLVRIDSERYYKATGKTESQTRYYISSLVAGPEHFNKAVRGHWAIENNLHWILDVSFNEDGARKRAGNQAQNLNVVFKVALTLLKDMVTEKKKSLKRKKLNLLLDTAQREKILKLVD